MPDSTTHPDLQALTSDEQRQAALRAAGRKSIFSPWWWLQAVPITLFMFIAFFCLLIVLFEIVYHFEIGVSATMVASFAAILIASCHLVFFDRLCFRSMQKQLRKELHARGIEL